MKKIALIILLIPLICYGDQKVLHPDYPVVEGRYNLTNDWSLLLDQAHNRRVEDGSLVLWRPNFTIWLNLWNNDKDASKEERLKWIMSDASKDASDIILKDVGETKLYYYRLDENRGGKSIASLNGFSISVSNHIQLSIYFDNEEGYVQAKNIVESLEYKNH